MSKTEIYNTYHHEISEAQSFLKMYKNDEKFQKFTHNMRGIVGNCLHSDIWSLTYDFIQSNFPLWNGGKVVTGLTYLLEIGDI